MRSRIPALLALLAAGTVAAQELEPRSYSASPIGTSFLVLGYGRSTGAVLFDPTVPIDNVNGSVTYLSPGFGHVFAIGKVQALFTAQLPTRSRASPARSSRPAATARSNGPGSATSG